MFLFSQISNQLLCDILKLNYLCTKVNQQYTNFRSPSHNKDRKTDPYPRSTYRGEGDRDSDINHLATDNLWQYNTVTNQC